MSLYMFSCTHAGDRGARACGRMRSAGNVAVCSIQDGRNVHCLLLVPSFVCTRLCNAPGP